MKFRKKPVEIEAIQYTGENLEEILEFVPMKAGLQGDNLCIITLEGVMRCDVGDWIIKGIKGEFYPCKPDIFDLTYEIL